MTKYNQTTQTVFFCSAFQAPRWPPSARSPSVNVPHRHSMEMSLIWMYLLYFNTGSLSEMILKQKDITDCGIQYFRGVIRCYCAHHVADNVNRGDEKKSHLISSRDTELSFHMLVYDDAAHRASCKNIHPKVFTHVPIQVHQNVSVSTRWTTDVVIGIISTHRFLFCSAVSSVSSHQMIQRHLSRAALWRRRPVLTWI